MCKKVYTKNTYLNKFFNCNPEKETVRYSDCCSSTPEKKCFHSLDENARLEHDDSPHLHSSGTTAPNFSYVPAERRGPEAGALLQNRRHLLRAREAARPAHPPLRRDQMPARHQPDDLRPPPRNEPGPPVTPRAPSKPQSSHVNFQASLLEEDPSRPGLLLHRRRPPGLSRVFRAGDAVLRHGARQLHRRVRFQAPEPPPRHSLVRHQRRRSVNREESPLLK